MARNRRLRKLPASPAFSVSSSTPAIGKSRQRIPRDRTEEEEDDYAEASPSPSLYDESQGDENEQSVNEDEYSAYDESNEKGNRFHQSSSHAPRYVSESNHIDGVRATSSVSASNFSNPSQPISQNAPYIQIAPLPVFRGTPSECPITHLSRFNKVCRANNVSSIEMLIRIFPVTLEDEAAFWYDLNIEPYPSLSWDEIKSSFLQAYYKVELVEELRSELMTINQGEKESVRSYFLRLQWILKRWPESGLPDALLKGIFIDGLRPEFHDWILLQKPNSLNDTLRLAFSFEQLRSIRETEQNVQICGFCEGKHEEQDCAVRQGMEELCRQSKEKQQSESDVATKELVRSISMGTRCTVKGKIGGDEEEKGIESMAGNLKKSQCQCWKHECWKKKLERNSSIVSRVSGAE
ncbi:hypothetical protein L6164_018611 [Bauhinia variegata]|uniref:Uncharacterized protein n=1 Tax=Bauhinia variegata TaxID=167791 RepID=A0ACB9NBK3_BAUVA|nr:hypothetical protein L6164_018611 [Bauhinia variegata]